MKGSAKISVWQLFCVLLLSRLLSTLTFSPVGAEKINTSDYFPSVLFAAILIFLFSIPLFIQKHFFPGKDITDVAYTVSPLLSKASSISYVLCFLFFTLVSLARLEMFVGTIVFPNNDSALFIILCVAAACYAATLGIEAIGRVGTISLVLFGGAFLFIMITMADKVDPVNLSPVFYEGVKPSLTAALDAATRTGELAFAAVLLPRADGKMGKAYAAGLFAFTVCAELILFFVFAGLGDFALSQMFPVHAVAMLAEFSVFLRFDVLLTGAWILTAFIKISLLLYMQSELLQKSFSRKWNKLYVLCAGLLVLIIQVFFAGTVSDYYFAAGLSARVILYIVFVVAVPSVILVAALMKRRGKRAKNS